MMGKSAKGERQYGEGAKGNTWWRKSQRSNSSSQTIMSDLCHLVGEDIQQEWMNFLNMIQQIFEGHRRLFHLFVRARWNAKGIMIDEVCKFLLKFGSSEGYINPNGTEQGTSRQTENLDQETQNLINFVLNRNAESALVQKADSDAGRSQYTLAEGNAPEFGNPLHANEALTLNEKHYQVSPLGILSRDSYSMIDPSRVKLENCNNLLSIGASDSLQDEIFEDYREELETLYGLTPVEDEKNDDANTGTVATNDAPVRKINGPHVFGSSALQENAENYLAPVHVHGGDENTGTVAANDAPVGIEDNDEDKKKNLVGQHLLEECSRSSSGSSSEDSMDIPLVIISKKFHKKLKTERSSMLSLAPSRSTSPSPSDNNRLFNPVGIRDKQYLKSKLMVENVAEINKQSSSDREVKLQEIKLSASSESQPSTSAQTLVDKKKGTLEDQVGPSKKKTKSRREFFKQQNYQQFISTETGALTCSHPSGTARQPKNKKLGSSRKEKRRPQCPECQKFFARNQTMIRHLKEIHKKFLNGDPAPEEEFTCPEDCGSVFRRLRDLRNHLSRCHDSCGNVCDNCGKLMKNAWALVRHKKRTCKGENLQRGEPAKGRTCKGENLQRGEPATLGQP